MTSTEALVRRYCVHICPHAARHWEIHLNALPDSPASERRFPLSRHRFARPDRLRSVTSHPVLFSFCPDYESTGFLLWKFNGKLSEIVFFFPLRKEVKVGEQLGHASLSSYWWLKQWFIRSGDPEADADGVCGAVVMADLFTCSKYLHLTHICNAPVSAETRLL